MFIISCESSAISLKKDKNYFKMSSVSVVIDTLRVQLSFARIKTFSDIMLKLFKIIARSEQF